MVKRKICVLTGTRAEYGLLRYLMQAIRDSQRLQLQVLVTGMHLSPEFGLTFRDIEADGFSIDRKVEMLLSSDTPVGIAKSTGLGVMGIAESLQELSPDLLVLLGDRFEVLSSAIAALFARIPVAHLHGGETTRGAFDEGIRHAVTKMSHLHFVATEEFQRRVIQLGEDPDRVFLVGGLGVDGIQRTRLLGRDELESQWGWRFGKRNLLITFHPATLENATAEHQFRELLAALDSMDDDVHFLFTYPNADTDGRVLHRLIDEYVTRNGTRAAAFKSLGQLRYWSTMALVNAVVGNSSSGLLEAPTFRIGTVNIGDRQAGRVMADSVVSCEPTRDSIRAAVAEVLSPAFQSVLASTTNPYGSGGAVERIMEVLETVSLDEAILKKAFHDLIETWNAGSQ